MERPLRHFSLHRVGDTELRVVSDVDEGVIPIVQVEEEVIRGYAARACQVPRCVSLFILRDLEPLLRRLPPGVRLPTGDASLMERPVVNVYGFEDPSTCHVFVNRESMQRAGYWDDVLAIRGLLAHEHAHPMVESGAVLASRRLTVELTWAAPFAGPGAELEVPHGQWRERVDRFLAELVEKLCVSAPREIVANELAIRSGFHAALLHLDRRNIANAARSVEGRQALVGRLADAVRGGDLSPDAADLLTLIGDMRGYLDMALEVAAFLRAGREVAALELEAGLRASVFPALEPETLTAYEALRDGYVALAVDATPEQLVEWSAGLVEVLATALRSKALQLNCRVAAVA